MRNKEDSFFLYDTSKKQKRRKMARGKKTYEVGDVVPMLTPKKGEKGTMKPHRIDGFEKKSLAKGQNKNRSKGRVVTMAYSKQRGVKKFYRVISNEKIRKTKKKGKSKRSKKGKSRH
jgi:hypothetical protein